MAEKRATPPRVFFFEQPCSIKGVVMRKSDTAIRMIATLAGLAACLPMPAPAQNLICGIKPIPELGCRIGRCVDGAWEQICD